MRSWSRARCSAYRCGRRGALVVSYPPDHVADGLGDTPEAERPLEATLWGEPPCGQAGAQLADGTRLTWRRGRGLSSAGRHARSRSVSAGRDQARRSLTSSAWVLLTTHAVVQTAHVRTLALPSARSRPSPYAPRAPRRRPPQPAWPWCGALSTWPTRTAWPRRRGRPAGPRRRPGRLGLLDGAFQPRLLA